MEEKKPVEKVETQKALVVKEEKQQGLSLHDMQVLALEIYQSGHYADLRNKSQALSKIILGQELGLPPAYSCTHLYIVPGKPPATDGQAMAGLIKKNGFSYKEKEHVPGKKWVLDMIGKKGEVLGQGSFTIEEAEKAGLLAKQGFTWKGYPDDMLFWKAIARGARRWCPEAIGGLYLKEEIDLEIEGSEIPKAEIITVEAVEVNKPEPVKTEPIKEEPKKEEPKPEPEKKKPGRPPKAKEEEKPKTQAKSREDIIQILKESFGKDKIYSVKHELNIGKDVGLMDLPDEDFQKFLEKIGYIPF